MPRISAPWRTARSRAIARPVMAASAMAGAMCTALRETNTEPNFTRHNAPKMARVPHAMLVTLTRVVAKPDYEFALAEFS